MSIQGLPIMLLKYLLSFLENDLESFGNFSLTCKRYYALFNHIRSILCTFTKHFPKHYRTFLKDIKNLVLIKTMREKTILHFWLEEEFLDFEKIKFLVEKKSDLNSVNEDNETALHLACKNKSMTFDIIENLGDFFFFF